MQTFNQALQALVASGEIAPAEALTAAPNPEQLRMRMQGVVLTDGARIINARACR